MSEDDALAKNPGITETALAELHDQLFGLGAVAMQLRARSRGGSDATGIRRTIDWKSSV